MTVISSGKVSGFIGCSIYFVTSPNTEQFVVLNRPPSDDEDEHSSGFPRSWWDDAAQSTWSVMWRPDQFRGKV